MCGAPKIRHHKKIGHSLVTEKEEFLCVVTAKGEFLCVVTAKGVKMDLVHEMKLDNSKKIGHHKKSDTTKKIGHHKTKIGHSVVTAKGVKMASVSANIHY
jgi:hypothetical protein